MHQDSVRIEKFERMVTEGPLKSASISSNLTNIIIANKNDYIMVTPLYILYFGD